MAARLREYEVEIRPGRWQRMKLDPAEIEEHVRKHKDGDRFREVKAARPPANKGRTPANKSGG